MSARAKTLGFLVLLTVLAFFCADAIAAGIAAAHVVPPPGVVVAGGGVASTSGGLLPADEYVKSTQEVLGRPAEISLTGNPAPPSSEQPQSQWDQWISGDPQKTMVLLGTMVGPESSIAMIAVGTEQYVLRTGETVGTWRVDSVSDMAVTFRKDKEVRKLTLPMVAPPGVASAPAPAPVAAPQTGGAPIGLAPTIPVRMQGNTRILPRDQVVELFRDPTKIMTTARLQPVSKDGKPYGVKISYMDPNSVFGALGLQPEDVLLNINGHEFKTPDEAFYNYQVLQNESTLLIHVERGGRPVEIPVEMR